MCKHVGSEERVSQSMQVCVDATSTMGPSKRAEWLWEVEEGMIKAALQHLHDKYSSCLESLKDTLSPSRFRGVATLRVFDKGELTLVPITLSVALRAAKDGAPTGSVYLKTYTDPKGKEWLVALMASGAMQIPKEDESVTGIGRLKQSVGASMSPSSW